MTRQGNAGIPVSSNVRRNSINFQKVISDETYIEIIDQNDDTKLHISKDCKYGKQKILS